jgi:hypothetical protein
MLRDGLHLEFPAELKLSAACARFLTRLMSPQREGRYPSMRGAVPTFHEHVAPLPGIGAA